MEWTDEIKEEAISLVRSAGTTSCDKLALNQMASLVRSTGRAVVGFDQNCGFTPRTGAETEAEVSLQQQEMD